MQNIYHKTLFLISLATLLASVSAPLHAAQLEDLKKYKNTKKNTPSTAQKKEKTKHAVQKKRDQQTWQIAVLAGSIIIVPFAGVVYLYLAPSSAYESENLTTVVRKEVKTLHQLIEGSIDKTYPDSIIAKRAKRALTPEVYKFRENILDQLEKMGIKNALAHNLPKENLDQADDRIKSPYIAALRLLMYDKIPDTLNGLKIKNPYYETYLTAIGKTTQADLALEIDKIANLHPGVSYINNKKLDKNLFIQHLQASA